MKKFLLYIVVLFAITLGGLLYFWTKASHQPVFESSPAVTQMPYFFDIEPEKAYGHSVVPGGIQSVEEFRHYVSTNSALKAWMQGFDWENAHVEQVCGAVRMTFRRNETIRWTVRTVPLKHCEPVITDGKRAFLMRCGNEISWTPREPSEEIDTAELETPVLTDIPGIPVEVVDVGNPMTPGGFLSPPSLPVDAGLLPPPGCCVPLPRVPTPEPPILTLLVPGVVALIVLRKRKNASTVSNKG